MSVALQWNPAGLLDAMPATVEMRNGDPLTIRLLKRDDHVGLDGFLRRGLSDASKSRFGAHRPDELSCLKACEQIGADGTIRIVALSEGVIVGYLILDDHIIEERARYACHRRVELVNRRSVKLAPAVADSHHAQGIGSHLVDWALSLARQLGIETVVLWGGTHDDNVSGRALYERSGFAYVGTFITGNLAPDLVEHDMYVSLHSTEGNKHACELTSAPAFA